MRKQRRILLIPVLLFYMILSFFNGEGLAKGRIVTLEAMKAQKVEAGETVLTPLIDLNRLRASGYFSLQVTISGGGSFDIKTRCSLDGKYPRVPDGVGDVAVGLTSTSGPLGDGHLFLPVDVGAVTRYLQFEVTETSGTSSGTVTLILGVSTDQ